MLYNNVGRIAKHHLTSRQHDLLALLIFSPCNCWFLFTKKEQVPQLGKCRTGVGQKRVKIYWVYWAYFTAMHRPGFFKHDLPAMIQVPKLSNYDKFFQCGNWFLYVQFKLSAFRSLMEIISIPANGVKTGKLISFNGVKPPR